MKYLVTIENEDGNFDFVLCEKENLEYAKDAVADFVLLNTNRMWEIEIMDEQGPCLFGVSTDDEVEWSEV
jgi:hypothetical protein